MRNFSSAAFCLAFFAICTPHRAAAQNTTGSIEFAARLTPTAGRPEPVRQFTFYLLQKSYADITRETENSDPRPTREEFIAGLKLSSQLKEWMKAHDTIDLAASEIEQTLTADDILNIPEFLDAYLRANGGGVMKSLPRPKYTEADKTANSERYRRLHTEYLAALRKFILANPQASGGMEAYLDPVSPARKWNQLNSEHLQRLQRRTPEIAQTKYLLAKADTDLEGRAILTGIPAGTYWLSTLGLEAASGDVRVRWDVPVTVESGKTSRAELTNLNATDAHPQAP